MPSLRLFNKTRQAVYSTLVNGESCIIASFGTRIIDSTMLSSHLEDLRDEGVIVITDADGALVPPTQAGNPHLPQDAASRKLLRGIQPGFVCLQVDTEQSYLYIGNDPTQDGSWRVLSAASTGGGTVDISGKADLIDGKLDPAQVPDLALTTFLGEAADLSEMLAMRGQGGDWCIRTDVGSTYILTNGNGSLEANWTAIVSSDAAALIAAQDAQAAAAAAASQAATALGAANSANAAAGAAMTAVAGVTTSANNALAGKFNTAAAATANTVALNYADTNLYSTYQVSGAVTFTQSGFTKGTKSVLIKNTAGTASGITFPASWTFLGNIPSSIPAGKVAVISVTCFATDGTEGGSTLVAAAGVQN